MTYDIALVLGILVVSLILFISEVIRMDLVALLVLGALAIYKLPIAQYPPIAPPSIAIDSFYPGASAQTVENSVTQIIEQKMTGFDDSIIVRVAEHTPKCGPHPIT